ncbi:hypothetical protein ACIRPT_02565 [Streptomyces sp. NPDC101227]|uniref:hypothetical protein n=1 Tax=Streptomyces sp. NPDC101227 TaxID=3366136 RepID=UPI0038153E12
MAWTAPLTWTPNQVLTAAQLNTHLRDNMLETEAAKATGGGGYFVATGANAIAERQAAHAETTASSTTTATTYGNLADGINTSVTVTTGPQCLILWGCHMQASTTTSITQCSITWSGASAGSADDSYAAYRKLQNYSAYPAQFMHHLWVTGMTPGSTTFTLKYRILNGGTGTFSTRRIAVFPY